MAMQILWLGKNVVWSVDEGKIKITIKGDAGSIVKEYILKNEIYFNTLS